MKNRLRDHTSSLGAFLLLLVPLLLPLGCGEDPQRSTAAEVTIGADPVAQILEILAINDRFDRTEKLIATLRALPAEQVNEVIPAALDQMDTPLRDIERVFLVSRWAKANPPKATRWAMASEHEDLLRSMMFDEAVYLWAFSDTESIRTDLKVSLYSLRSWDPTMLRAFVRGWYDSGEPDLVEYIRDMSLSGDDRQRALSQLIKTKLADSSPDEMIAWATNLRGEKSFLSYIYSRLAADIAAIDPARAVAWCEEVCDTEVAEDLPHWIASSWVREGGVDAMDWIVSQPDTLSARIGIRSSFRRFANNFPEESDTWVENFSEEDRRGENLQGPVLMYINRQSSLNKVDVALEWTKYIGNDWERERSLSTIARRWLRQDEDAANAWLTETTELAEVTKTELREAAARYKKKVEKSRADIAARPDWVSDALEK